ncbi:MAG: LysR family transcriptional regulator [Xenophilus sp.]
MSDHLQGIEVFVAAVEAGSFARAATRLHLTRSAVGKGIARLEARLGQRLFHRTTRHQSLTDEGRQYYAHARRALDELEAADSALREGRQEAAGRVRITLPELLGRRCAAPLLLALGRRHRGLELRLHLSDSRLNLIEEGLDLALRSGPLEDSSTLAVRRIGYQSVGVYAAPAYLATHPRPANAQELIDTHARHCFLNYAHGGWVQPWRFHDGADRSIVFDAPARFACNSLELTALAAADGLGLARLPTWLAAPSVAAGTLVRVFDEPQPFCYPLHLLWPRVPVVPLRLRRVIDMLASELPPLIDPGRGVDAGPSPSPPDS